MMMVDVELRHSPGELVRPSYSYNIVCGPINNSHDNTRYIIDGSRQHPFGTLPKDFATFVLL